MTVLTPYAGTVVAVRLTVKNNDLDVRVENPTDTEVEAAATANPAGFRQLAAYLKEHNPDEAPYRRNCVGFSAFK